ncbi:MAG TPA: YqaJ viral recombinase family protein [Streptosporangiaceae bacterium]|nr:YqaJ viral recombinase family protein [Streptosporangiaceae bacterium]
MPELLPYAPLTPEWHAARRGGVTATDIVTILGLSSWDSVYSLFWRKLGQVPDVPDSDRFRLGRELEPYVRERWAQERAEPWHFEGGVLYRHSGRPWQMATPDYLVGPGLDYREPLTGVLEVKTWASADMHSWQDGPPARVRAQVLWQMDVMDVAAGHVGVVFLPSGEFRSYTIEHHHGWRDEVTGLMSGPIECSECYDIGLMRHAGEEFMGRLRLELPPPDPDASAATLAAVRARFARQPDKQADVEPGTWAAWVNYRDVMDHAEREARLLESQLREQAGEAAILTVDGQPVARRVIVDAQVKAHTRHQDYLKRIKQEGDGDA